MVLKKKKRSRISDIKLTWGIYFVEKQHLENATDSPSMSKVLHIKMIIAHNDNTEALKDTKVLSEFKESNYTQCSFNALAHLKALLCCHLVNQITRTFNTQVFGHT